MSATLWTLFEIQQISGASVCLRPEKIRKAFISFFSRVYKVATAVRALFAAHEEYKYKTKPNHAA